jgi:hypothetical protein
MLRKSTQQIMMMMVQDDYDAKTRVVEKMRVMTKVVLLLIAATDVSGH